MTSFYFFHSLKELRLQKPSDKNIFIWETCLRKIIFSENQKPVKNHLELFEDEAALIFLIEVLCGLQSKVIGETEIFGQFKQFILSEEGQKISFFQNPQFVQFIFKQVKEIREKHITGLGVNSYGSLIRKICQNDEEISLIGYGQLAKKILPWISQRKVKIHVRDKSKYIDSENHQFVNLQETNFYSTVIVAASMKTENLFTFIRPDANLKKIVDCRSLDENDSSIKLSTQAEVIDLKDLFASIEAKQDNMKTLLPIIKNEIQERVQAYYLKVQHRPQGWEDLCG